MTRSLLTGLFLLMLPFLATAQVASIATGDWNNTNTWDCGCVPTSALGLIRISSNHEVTVSTTITADEVVVSADGELIIASGGRLILNDDVASDDLTQESADPPTTNNDAIVRVEAGGILENRGQIAWIETSLLFESDSEYQHNQNGNALPTATWEAGSTCRITGWGNVGGGTPLLNFRTSLNQTFHHFIWDNSGQTAANVQLLGTLHTVNGNLEIRNTSNGNRQLSLGGNNLTLTVGGDLIVTNLSRVSFQSSGSGTYTTHVSGNCTLETSHAAPPVGPSNHFIIGGTNATGITNLTVDGNLVLGSGQFNLAPGAGAGNVNVGGNFDLDGGTIIKTGAGNGTIFFTGATTHTLNAISGTFDAGNLNVAAGTLDITGTTLLMAGNITVQNGATLNMPAAISTSGNITFGTTSTINAGTGTITLTGGGTAQTIDGGGHTLNNITVTKSVDNATVTLTSALSVAGELNINSPGATSATVFNSNGNLTLLSTSDDATGNARIAPLANLARVNGNVTVQRFMSSEGRIYRYISPAVARAPISQVQDDFPVTGSFPQTSACSGCTTNPSLRFYDAATQLYVAFPTTADTDSLRVGRGYSAFVRQNVLPGAVTLDLTGIVNQGTRTLPVVHNAVVAESWNLVGNPYPSSIDWDNAGWTKTNINGSVAVRDNVTDGGGFRYWNGTTVAGVGTGLPGGMIAAGQAFWVQTTAASPVLTVTETVKTTTAPFHRTQTTLNALSITLAKGDLKDMTVFQIHDEASTAFDYFDAPKMVNDHFDFSTRFTVTGGLFAINAVKEIPCGTELFLDLRFTKDEDGLYVVQPPGQYSISFEQMGTEFNQYKISLVDNFTSTVQTITPNSVYQFQIDNSAASMAAGRFKLVFDNSASFEAPSISTDGGDVLVSNYKTGLKWYFNNELITGQTTPSFRAYNSGVYKVEVTLDECSIIGELNYAVTGLEGNSEREVKAFPNPFAQKIHVSFEGYAVSKEGIRIINMMGQDVSKSVPVFLEQTRAELDFGYLPDAPYIIYVNLGEGGVKALKVIRASR